MIRFAAPLLGLLLAGPALADTPNGSAWTDFPSASAGVPPGKIVFENYCSACHGAGSGMPGTAALAAKYQGKLPALLEQRTDLAPDTVKYFVRHGISVMPFFRKSEVSDSDLAALADYLGKAKP